MCSNRTLLARVPALVAAACEFATAAALDDEALQCFVASLAPTGHLRLHGLSERAVVDEIAAVSFLPCNDGRFVAPAHAATFRSASAASAASEAGVLGDIQAFLGDCGYALVAPEHFGDMNPACIGGFGHACTCSCHLLPPPPTAAQHHLLLTHEDIARSHHAVLTGVAVLEGEALLHLCRRYSAAAVNGAFAAWLCAVLWQSLSFTEDQMLEAQQLRLFPNTQGERVSLQTLKVCAEAVCMLCSCVCVHVHVCVCVRVCVCSC